LKLDGYRALAIKNGGKVQLRSRNDKDFKLKYPAIVKALSWLPDETFVDGRSPSRTHSSSDKGKS
jgi:ATP-dependent DNA ligase